jgi:two-component system chemotaxis response regulator CheB
MWQRPPIRVLVVDDSLSARNAITSILASDSRIVIAGEAVNGLEALALVSSLQPDVVTMDLEMPVMGGLEAIDRIMAQHPVPILVVTSVTGVRTAFDAMTRGAMDVIVKPGADAASRTELVKRVKLLAQMNLHTHPSIQAVRPDSDPGAARVRQEGVDVRTRPDPAVVAIAASTGGPQAIQAILSRLPEDFPLPIVVAQHMALGFTKGMADWLDGGATLRVAEARHGDRLRPGTVYLNPAEASMTVTPQHILHLEAPPSSQIHHPSCDFLLKSVAKAFGGRAVAAILSGMGSDGAAGMRAIKAAGGLTLAQDAESSVVFGMNRAAVEVGCIDKVLPLGDIPGELVRQAGSGRG